MSECRHYEICGLPMMDSLAGLCILHSRLKDKDVREFDKALKEHRETRGDQFAHMVFPEKWLSRLFETFAAKTSFRNATFSARADFSRVSFSAGADFLGATFSARPNFSGAAFSAGAEFLGATFSAGANFQVRLFSGGNITFKQCRFSGRTLFAQLPEAGAQQIPRIFTGATTVNFSDIAIEPPESLSFRHADFRICRFLNTDLRKVELTGALWAQKGTRWVVYDEMAPVPHEPYPWEQLERLYRELKQNYDDRRNYPRVGDFHYGEKEIQRRNPATPLSLKVFLWLYWLVSGYGERFLRPLLWAVGFWALATVGYLLSSLSPAKEAAVPALAIADPATWGHAVLYSLQVMLFFRPPDFVLSTVLAKTMYTLQSLLGPLVLGLFALAVRQRLRH